MALNVTEFIGKCTAEETVEIATVALQSLTDEQVLEIIQEALEDRDLVKDELAEAWKKPE
jgi:RNA-binding protein YhbY